MDTEERFDELRTLTQKRNVHLVLITMYPREYNYLKSLGYRELTDESASLAVRVNALLKNEQSRNDL